MVASAGALALALTPRDTSEALDDTVGSLLRDRVDGRGDGVPTTLADAVDAKIS